MRDAAESVGLGAVLARDEDRADGVRPGTRFPLAERDVDDDDDPGLPVRFDHLERHLSVERSEGDAYCQRHDQLRVRQRRPERLVCQPGGGAHGRGNSGVGRDRVVRFVNDKGWGDYEAFRPRGRPALRFASDVEIVLAYNAEWRGFANYYALADDVKRKLNKGTVRISVCGRAVDHQAAMALMKRSPKITANCAFAMVHSRGGIFHSFSDRFKIR